MSAACTSHIWRGYGSSVSASAVLPPRRDLKIAVQVDATANNVGFNIYAAELALGCIRHPDCLYLLAGLLYLGMAVLSQCGVPPHGAGAGFSRGPNGGRDI